MADPNFYIETPRLYISYLNPDNDAHCDFLVALYNSPEFIASIGGKPTSITTREAARKQLAGRFRNEHARNGYGTYLVSLKPESPAETTSDTGKKDVTALLAAATPVGTVGLMRGEEPDRYEAPDLGFVVLPAHMRKGYTKEACLALMDYVEREQGVSGVFGFCEPTNEASRSVFRSLGFSNRGILSLRVFGGAKSEVWAKPGMAEDLSVYGL